MDILYLVGPKSKCEFFDLRCSLRSIDMYGKNVDRVFVCGYCPEFLSENVIKLNLEIDPNMKKNKNIWRQIVYCVKNTDIGSKHNGDFLISMDDHFYMKSVDFNKYPVLAKLSGDVHGGMLPQTPNPERKSHKGYENILIHTNKFCANHKLPAVFLTLHANMKLNRYSIEQMDDLNNEMFNYKDSDLECIVIAQNYRLLNNPFRIVFAKDFKSSNAQSVKKMLKANKRKVFSTGDFEIGDDMYNVLKEKYPNKSKYEK